MDMKISEKKMDYLRYTAVEISEFFISNREYQGMRWPHIPRKREDEAEEGIRSELKRKGAPESIIDEITWEIMSDLRDPHYYDP